MKVFTASMATETNTFSPLPTGQESYARRAIIRGGAYGDHPSMFVLPLVIFRQRAQEHGWRVVESLCAHAAPCGVTVRSVYEGFRDEILRDLEAAMPVDMALLMLHGAMVAEGYDDCEGDLIASVRRVVGPQVPIGAELDLHCHLTQAMLENATALVAYKTYPHIDHAERANELFAITADAAQGRTKPCMSVFDCRMIGRYPTTVEPMKSYVSRLKDLEGKDGVLSISVAHSFAWSDVPELGTKILVVTDNRPDYGAALAERLGRELFALRDRIVPRYLSIGETLDRALAVERTPVVIADVSDNPGGGAPGDSTFILRTLLERGIKDVAFGPIYDPVATAIAMEAGEGAQLRLRIGGKLCPESGDPLDLTVRVTGVARNATQRVGALVTSLGDTVAVRSGSLDLVLGTERMQAMSPDLFVNVGVDLQQKRLVVVKSAQHFQAGFSPMAGEILYCSGPGALTPDPVQIPYRRIDRRQWPFVENPFDGVCGV